MSLAFDVDPGREDVTAKVTVAVGLAMCTALTAAAIEQAVQANGPWWLSLLCVVACAVWCRALRLRHGRRQPVRLQVNADGSLLLLRNGAEAADAIVLRGWGLGRLVFLRIAVQIKVDPQPAAANDGQSILVCETAVFLFVLARGSFDEFRWHALRRWLVWLRRSHRHEGVAT